MNDTQKEMTVEQLAEYRLQEANNQFEHWCFPLPVKDVSGWEGSGGAEYMRRSVFLETEGDSIKVLFRISFVMGTSQIARVECIGVEEQPIGHRQV